MTRVLEWLGLSVPDAQSGNGLIMIVVGVSAAVLMIYHANVLRRGWKHPLARRLFWVPVTDALIMGANIWGGILLYNKWFDPAYWVVANASQWITGLLSIYASWVVISFYVSSGVQEDDR